ncbi:MAG: hypothetical protein MJ204_03120 [Bacteroidales bacterium]|nr:hypothetical protein [Bacteroidales bacterium]
MKKNLLTILFICCSIFSIGQNDKKIYFTNAPELTFQIPEMTIINNSADKGIRTTYLLNIPYTMHINCGKYFGFMPSLNIKNIGFKTKNEQIDSIEYAKVKRSLITTGASLAIKFGLLQKGLWGYIGGGIDLSLLYRQKKYEPSKNNKVIKESAWLSDATETWIPSLYVGIQLPEGLNIKFAYYYQDLLNKQYNGSLGDFTNITKSQLFTISASIVIPDFKLSDIERNHNHTQTTEL